MNSRTFPACLAIILSLVATLTAPAADPAPARTKPPAANTRQQPGESPAPSSDPDEFAQMDANHDGRVSANEYAASPQSAVDRIALGKRQGPAGITGGFDLRDNEGRPQRSELFQAMDTDGDGYLSRSEVEAAEQPGKEEARR